jgi:L-2-hydroxyglutarate oxidase LhgO
VALHQSSRNSGVVHAGIHYAPGSLKAKLSSRGRQMLRDFCRHHMLPYEQCGQLIVARNRRDEIQLQNLYERGLRNKVPGLRWLCGSTIGDIEPHAVGRASVHSPVTAITDFHAISQTLALEIQRQGGEILTGCEVLGIRSNGHDALVMTAAGGFTFDQLVICAGLHADRLAVMAGEGRHPLIVPFRGDYMVLQPNRSHLVRGLIYPVPDPRYPFLGIHVTKTISGTVLLGPSAVLATAREGYSAGIFDRTDVRDLLRSSGFRRLARKHWRAGGRELYRTLNRRSFVREVRSYLPDISYGDLQKGPSGVRAQAVTARGDLLDDFCISQTANITNVRNAPSPGATSALAIADLIAEKILKS